MLYALPTGWDSSHGYNPATFPIPEGSSTGSGIASSLGSQSGGTGGGNGSARGGGGNAARVAGGAGARGGARLDLSDTAASPMRGGAVSAQTAATYSSPARVPAAQPGAQGSLGNPPAHGGLGAGGASHGSQGGLAVQPGTQGGLGNHAAQPGGLSGPGVGVQPAVYGSLGGGSSSSSVSAASLGGSSTTTGSNGGGNRGAAHRYN